jgi:hypothetical protein
MFSCTCTKCEQLNPEASVTPRSNNPISVPKERYANWVALGELLEKSGNSKSQVVRTELLEMISHLTSKDYSAYRATANNFLNHLAELPLSEKSTINAFFKSKGSDFSV